LTQWTTYQIDKQNDLTAGDFYRHCKPTASCFNFFPTAQKNLKFYGNHTNGTFAFAATRKTQHKAKAKEPFLANALFKS